METSKTKELANFHYISLTDKGNARENNEDYLGYFDTVNGHIFVVCDGCGGLPCGEKASQTVVNSLKFFFSNYYYEDPVQGIYDAVGYAQDRMTDEERINSETRGMATTLVLVLIRYNKAYYAHIGDSRIYFFSRRTLTQLTKDDSYVQTLVDAGELTPKEAEKHPRKNELTRVLGMTPPPKPHVCTVPVDPGDGDILLLCTDGLYNMVSERDIRATLSRRGYIEDKGMDLMKAAKDNGGLDNITFQIIKFYNLDNPKTDESPVSERPSSKRKKTGLLIGIPLVLALITGIIFALRYSQNRKTEASREPETAVFEICADTLSNADSVIRLFGIAPEKITYAEKNGKKHMYVPVKKIHCVRYYDNVLTLARLYDTDAGLIMRVNGLKDVRLEPGTELIIP